jgi:filamentous hemagglutinin family protein
MGLGSAAAIAQVITPATDGTGTSVTVNGDRLTISGGSLSADQLNLFHSFDRFGLNAQQTATFLSHPQTLNILGRVVGGEPSMINGLLEVVGSDANLYLMNPAGIVFGSQARLNVGGDFFATTADGIGLSDGGWFDAVGAMDYGQLTGMPFQFRFEQAEPGAIANQGQLTVGTGQQLGLIGGTVINTGMLTAAAGTVLVTAVPGENLVRLSQPGQLLSLEINPSQLTAATLSPMDLPSLLTGGDATVTSTGTLKLQSTAKEIPIAPGLAVHNGVIDVAGEQGGTVVIGGDAIALSGATINASGTNGGGTVLIGGEQQGGGSMPRANFTVIDETSQIRADAVDQGDGGRVILWADDTTAFYGDISARGGDNGGDGGFVEVSGAENLAFRGTADTAAPQGKIGSVLLDPTNITIQAGAGLSGFTGSLLFGDVGPTVIFESELEAITGAITLQATNDITFANSPDDLFDLTAATGSITLTAGNNITMQDTSDRIRTNGQNFNVTAGGNIQLGSITTTATLGDHAGDITAVAGGTLSVETLDTSVNALLGTLQGGAINLSTSQVGGDIQFQALDTAAFSLLALAITVQGGGVTLNAQGTVRGNTVDTAAGGIGLGTFTAGAVNVTHDGGSGNVAFTVGDSTVNGINSLQTSGAIAPGTFALLPTGGTVNPGAAMTLTSINTPPTVAALTRTATVGGPVVLTYGELMALVGDSNQDTITTLTLNNLVTTGTLTLNGVTISDRITPITLNPGDAIAYTSDPSTTPGTISLFDLIAHDGVSLNNATITATLTAPTPISPPASETTFLPSLPPTPLAESGLNCPPICSSPPPPLTARPILEPSPFTSLENQFTDTVLSHLGLESQPSLTQQDTQDLLKSVELATGVKPSVLYIRFVPRYVQPRPTATSLLTAPAPTSPPESDDDTLELLLVTGNEAPIRVPLPDVTRAMVQSVVGQMQRTVKNRRSRAYEEPAHQLYQWFIQPIAAALRIRQVGHLAFVADHGLRGVPFAALYDGEEFLIEQYSVSLMPSVSLSSFAYTDLSDRSVLAMGVNTFTDQSPLPAVSIELDAITKTLWPGDYFLNPQFTIANLLKQRNRTPHSIIHIATHGSFQPGQFSKSYLTLWDDQRLFLDQLRHFGFNKPMVELLVLSACQTALGDREAELGFTGLAVAAGVKTTMGSLWHVSDIGTLGLITAFYEALKMAPIRSKALQQAQLDLLSGRVTVEEAMLRLRDHSFPLPPLLAASRDFRHPYYWSSFTMVGSPW